MRKKIGVLLIGIMLMVLMASGAQATDDGLVPCGGDGQQPCTFQDLMNLIKNVMKFAMINLAIPAAVGITIYGGVLMVISQGNEAKFKKGKDIIQGVAIAFVIMFSAWLIVNTVMGFLIR